MIGSEAFDIESNIIGEMFSDNGILIEALSELTSDDFSNYLAKRIFDSAVKLFEKGKSIDPLTIQSEWNSDEKDELKQYLLTCYQSTVSCSAYKLHFEQLKQIAVKRKAKSIINDLHSQFEATEDIETLRESATNLLQALDNRKQETAVDFVTGFDKFINRIGKPRNYISTGIATLDYNLRIEKGDFIIVGGRPSSGKTALTLQMAVNMAERYKVVYFSLETSADKLVDRLVANKTTIDFAKIKRNELTEADKQRLSNDRGIFECLNLTIVNGAGMSVSQIQSKAIQLQADIIFIDYIGLINCGNNKLSSYEKMTQISIALHTMAQYQNICVFGLCQLNRGGNDCPDLRSLRDSGQIEQDADAVLLLHTPNQEEKTIKDLLVEKNKDGETGGIKLYFDGKHQRFSSYATDKSEYTDVPFDD